MNGSPLFTGDSGSGESEIRRFVLENDLLEALIALPEQLFYNTGIATYVWLLSNRKAPGEAGEGPAHRRHLVLVADAPEPRRQAPRDPPGKGGGRVEAPRRLRGRRDPDGRQGRQGGRARRQPRLPDHSLRLPPDHRGAAAPPQLPGKPRTHRPAQGATRFPEPREVEEAGRRRRPRGGGGPCPSASHPRLPRSTARYPVPGPKAVPCRNDERGGEAGVRLPAAVRSAILAALGERDEKAEICRSEDGTPEPDPNLRDTERVPLPEGEDPVDGDGVPESVRAFFVREVTPHVPDAWIDTARRDPRDGRVGLIGYEVNFNRYFYRYTPPRPLEAIEADIQAIEKDILDMLKEMSIGEVD